MPGRKPVIYDGRMEIRSRFYRWFLSVVIKFLLSELDMPLTACLTPVLLKVVAAKNPNFVCNCVVLECAKESNSYMISQWPIDPTECVSEGILCPVLPASLTP